MEWTQENTLGFIELYEKMSVLWDLNHPKYYNKLHKHLPTRSSEQLVHHSAQPVCRNACLIVRTYTLGRAEPRAVMLHCYVAADCSSLDMALQKKLQYLHHQGFMPVKLSPNHRCQSFKIEHFKNCC
jgi:hypothetical protein